MLPLEYDAFGMCDILWIKYYFKVDMLNKRCLSTFIHRPAFPDKNHQTSLAHTGYAFRAFGTKYITCPPIRNLSPYL